MLATSLLLAACGSPAEQDTAATSDREPVRVDETLGVLRIAPGEPLRIGLVLDAPESDDLARELEAAARTALEDFGQVQQGFRATIEPALDAGCDTARAAELGAELANDMLLSAVLGPQCTSSLQGLQDPLGSAGSVIIAARPIDAALTATPGGEPAQDRVEGMWRTAPTRLDEARAAARFAVEELEAQRAAMLHDGSAESSAVAAAFAASFELLGGTVVNISTLDPVDAAAPEDALEVARDGLAATLAEVADARPDVALLALDSVTLAEVSALWDDQSSLRSVERLSGSDAATSDFLLDAVAEGHLIVVPVLQFPEATSAITGMSASQVQERVTAMSGVATVSGWWAYAYDATTLLLRALEDVSLIDNDGSLVISRSELRSALSRLSFLGLTGELACDALGDCSSQQLAVHRVGDAGEATLSDRTRVWSTTDPR